MLELKDFVAESLKQIIGGIANAQDFAKENKSYINPEGIIKASNDRLIVEMNNPKSQHPIPQFIEFDIAVTVSEDVENKAGIGVFSGPIAFGTQGKVEDANLTISRIKFSIPVLFPQQKFDK